MVAQFAAKIVQKKYIEFVRKWNDDVNHPMSLDEFDDNAPKYDTTNVNTSAKTKIIRKLNDPVTLTDAIRYFRKQTMCKDFVNFYFLVDKLHLDTDETGMIKFIRTFKASSIKKEALFVWWVINMIETDPFMSKYPELLDAYVQESLDHNITKKKGKKFDLSFPLLNIIIEIDEDHDMEVVTNDNYKDELARMNGSAMIRIATKPLLKCAYHDGIRQCNDVNNLLMTTKAKIIDTFIGSMLRFEHVRKGRLLFLFGQTVTNELNVLSERIEAKTAEISAMDPTDSRYKKFMLFRNGLINAHKAKLEIFKTMNGDMVKKLFELKRQTETDNIAVISFDDLKEIVQFKKAKDYDMLYEFIEFNGLFNDSYKFSWKDLSKIITECDIEEFKRIKKTLGEYYRNVETYYESFIKDLKGFYETAAPSREDYQQYFTTLSDTLYEELVKENKKLVDVNKTLTKENKSMKKDLEFYHERRRDLFSDRLMHNGKGDFCNMLLSKVKCIRYDLLIKRSMDKGFNSDLKILQDDLSDFLIKYKEYYDTPSRQEISFEITEELKAKYVKIFIEHQEKFKRDNLIIDKKMNDVLSNASISDELVSDSEEDPDELSSTSSTA